MTTAMTDPILLRLAPNGDGSWKIDVRADEQPEAMPLKYELVAQPGTDLFRAKALRNIYDAAGNLVVAKGELSGLLHGDRSLSQSGSAWVGRDARVLGGRVLEGATVKGTALIESGARISGNARVHGNAHVYDNAHVYGNAEVYGSASVSHFAQVYGNSHIHDTAILEGEVYVEGAQIGGTAKFAVGDVTRVYGGCITNNALVISPNGFLQINCQYGVLTVAPTQDRRWIGSIGCQDFDTFQGLVNLADDYSNDFVNAVLKHWFKLVKRALREWGVPKDVIVDTTQLDEEDDD